MVEHPAPLTAKQEEFCRQYIALGNQREAYRRAFQSKGKDATIDTEASRLLAQANIKARVEALQQQVTEKVVENVAHSKEEVLEELWDNAMCAKRAEPVRDREGNETGEYVAAFAASNAALIAYGKELGMFKDADKHDRTAGPFDGWSPDAIKAFRDDLAKLVGEPGPGKGRKTPPH